MVKHTLAAVAISSMLLFAGEVCLAQASPQLKMVVVLSRHGVRSPTWAQERLDSYSALPWPKFSVPPGNLTPRGHQLLVRFGGYDREWLASTGLLAATGCADAAKTFIYADTDQRTIESGQALGEGLFPGCTVALHGLPEGQNDPLFHPAAAGLKAGQADEVFAQLSAKLKQPGDAQQDARIDELKHVLQGCAPRGECKPVRTPEMSLPGDAIAAAKGKGDHLADLQGPLANASTLSEVFLLEFADGIPEAQVGWGQVDKAELGRLLALHTDYFELMHRTPAAAKIEAGNLARAIAATLDQARQNKPVEGAIGPVGTKLVMLAGHDTNLAALSALLGVDWKLDGRDNDTPPGTEMVFELWQGAHGASTVTMRMAMQTLDQLRDARALTLKAPPAVERVTPKGCDAKSGCAWEQFSRLIPN